MSRLKRFDEYRFIGTRDTMRVYDTDDDEQFEGLKIKVEEGDLVERNLIQTFAPDTLEEARNRSFKPI